MIQIDGEKIWLRELNTNDVTEQYVAWMNDDETKKYMEFRHGVNDIESVKTFVWNASIRNDTFLFGIFLPSGTHIGNIKLGPVHAIYPLADVGLLIGDKNERGKGYGVDAIRCVTRFAFGDHHRGHCLRKLSAGMYAENVASWKAFSRAGFKMEGRREKHYMLDGKMVDILEYGLVKSD